MMRQPEGKRKYADPGNTFMTVLIARKPHLVPGRKRLSPLGFLMLARA